MYTGMSYGALPGVFSASSVDHGGVVDGSWAMYCPNRGRAMP